MTKLGSCNSVVEKLEEDTFFSWLSTYKSIILLFKTLLYKYTSTSEAINEKKSCMPN